jgi:hypothetical protein
MLSLVAEDGQVELAHYPAPYALLQAINLVAQGPTL